MLHNLENTIYTASRGKMQLTAAGYSSAGVKPNNEDAYAVKSSQLNEFSTKGIVAVIADGVSHAQHAAKASLYCTEEFCNAYYDAPTTWSSKRIISDILRKINTHLFGKNSQTNSNSAGLAEKAQWLTTFSGIIFKSASMHIFHVGDTQISRIRKGKYQILTNPHNQTLAKNSSVLTRAMGADNHLQVDYQQHELQIGDLLLLTTDGIHDHLHGNDFLEQALHIDSLDELSAKYVELATAKQSRDNLTCLLVKVLAIPQQQPEEIRQFLLQKVIPPVLEKGQILEGYKVIKVMHASSRSHLYLVEETATGKLFTLKAPSINFSDDEIYLQGFIREAWVGSQIDHPTIMKVYPTKVDAKFLYHICEYIDGYTLRQWMYDNTSPTLDEVRQIIQQVANALRAFKKLDIVHRDIKPENIMLDKDGQVKLIDYGTASVAALEEQIYRLTETHPLGTANYVAPETLINLTSNFKSDLFSLGVMTYEMLTGQLPYPEQTTHSKQTQYSNWQYQSAREHRSDIPFWFDLALRKAVEADPKSRYDLYSEFITDLSKPNLAAESEFKNRPFIERDPVKFWQIVSTVLALLVVYLLEL